MAATNAELLREAEGDLAAAGIASPRLDAEVLLSAAAGWERSRLYADLRAPVQPAVAVSFRGAVARRKRGEPVAYVTGQREFWSLRFAVDRRVLVPRPETELLVEIVSRLIDGSERARVCDVGTGSGCIAVALAHMRPRLGVLAVDVSREALAVARQNALDLEVAERVEFLCSDLLESVSSSTRFDVIVSNPPYLRAEEPVTAEVEAEPRMALRAGDDGLDTIRRLIAAAPAHLRPGGWLVMEFGCGQEDAVRDLADAAGFRNVCVHADLAGIPRALAARAGEPAGEP